jgi:hypothetical protein
VEVSREPRSRSGQPLKRAFCEPTAAPVLDVHTALGDLPAGQPMSMSLLDQAEKIGQIVEIVPSLRVAMPDSEPGEPLRLVRLRRHPTLRICSVCWSMGPATNLLTPDRLARLKVADVHVPLARSVLARPAAGRGAGHLETNDSDSGL